MGKKRLIILCALVILSVSGCGYNTMQTNEEAVKAAWGDVEATYQRRNDLIPNLVEVVKGYAKHERDTLTAVTEARAKVGTIQMSKDILEDPQAFAKFQSAQAEMGVAATESAADMSQLAGDIVYEQACVTCHGAGIAGAPRFGDKAAWAGRIEQGLTVLYAHALQGYQGTSGYMPPKGGRTDLTDQSVMRAVDYIVTAGQ